MEASDSKLTKEAFVQRYGEIYEESPWVAEAVYGQIQSNHLTDLAQLMAQVVNASSYQVKLDLIKAHPDLAGRAALAGDLSEASTSEQAGAGLDQCSEEELASFKKLNGLYKDKFGFPFIIAVSGLDRREILQHFKARLSNTPDQEFCTALREIHKIAGIRLAAINNTGDPVESN